MAGEYVPVPTNSDSPRLSRAMDRKPTADLWKEVEEEVEEHELGREEDGELPVKPARHSVPIAGLEDNTCRKYGYELLEGFPFQIGMGFAIIANALVIGMETDMPDLRVWEVVELLFLVVFTGELLLRLVVITPVEFFRMSSSDFVWNCFDFTVVCMGLFDTVGQKLKPVDQKKKHGGGIATLFRIIRLLRILRIFRIVRFLKQLYMLVFGFGVAAVATVWVTVLAVVILYVCSIIMVRMVQAMDREDDHFPLFATNFGSVGMSMFTLFQLMLNPDLTPYRSSMGQYVLMAAFLFAFVVFGSFGMLALLTGVISESMFEKNQVRLEEERGEREEKRKRLTLVTGDLFDAMAKSEGIPNTEDLSKQLLVKGIPRLIEILLKYGFALTEYDLVGVLNVTDTDDSGGISRAEFVHAVCSCCDGIQAATVMELHQSVLLAAVKAEKRNDALLEILLQHHNDLLSRQQGLLEAVEKLRRQIAERHDDGTVRKKEVQINTNKQGSVDSRRAEDAMQMVFFETQSPTRNGATNPLPSVYIGLDSKLALKIDSCEAIVRELRHTVNEVANNAREMIRRTPASSRSAQEAPPLREQIDLWTEYDFLAPLELSDMWKPSGISSAAITHAKADPS